MPYQSFADGRVYMEDGTLYDDWLRARYPNLNERELALIGPPVHVIRSWYVPPRGPSKPYAKKKAD